MFSLIALLFAAVVILTVELSGQFDFLAYVKGYENLDILTSLFIKDGNAYAALSSDIGAMGMIPPIGIIVMVVGAAACVICGIIGLARGKANAAFPIISAVSLVGAIVTAVGFIVADIIKVSEILSAIGLIVAVAATVLAMIFAIVAAVVGTKAKRDKNEPNA